MRKAKSKKKEAPKKPDLAIEVKNFGPISKGKIELKNLTVLIGPNNSGKSYMAMLVHAFASSYYQRFEPAESTLEFPRREIKRSYLSIVERNMPELAKWLLNSIAPNITEINKIPKEISREIIDELYKNYYKRDLRYKIEKLYACHQVELIKYNEYSCKIKISYNVNNTEILLGQDSKDMKIKNKFNIGDADYEIAVTHRKYLSSLTKREIAFELNLLLRNTIEEYHYRIAERSKIPFSDYLPAGRTGIMQCYRPFLANTVNNYAFSSTEKPSMPDLQGTVLEFLSNIVTMPNHEGPLCYLAVEFEQEIIKGEIFIERTLPGSFPRIQYKFKETIIPIHRTSSTVSELAPIILYLKHIIEPGNILIIEEPEAHLHPENQRLMAKLLVRLIRAGVYVIITTHSDFLLEQLSNNLMLSSVPENKKKLFDSENYLAPDEVAAYVFQQDKTGGYQIQPVEIDKEDGISDKEFLNVNKALYDETVRIKDAIMD